MRSKSIVGRFGALAMRMMLLNLLVVTFACLADPKDIEYEVIYFSERLKQDPYGGNTGLVEQLRWSGIQDHLVYDPVRDHMLERYRFVFADESADQVVALSKILALSGMDQYRADLEAIGGHRSIVALETLALQAHRNTVLTAGLLEAPKGRLDQRRTQNMLQSGDPEMIGVAAQRVYREYTSDSEIMASVNASLLKNYNLGMKNAVYHQSVRWLIKALAQSGDTKYRSTLEEVSEKAKSRRIARYAKKNLQKLL